MGSIARHGGPTVPVAGERRGAVQRTRSNLVAQTDSTRDGLPHPSAFSPCERGYLPDGVDGSLAARGPSPAEPLAAPDRHVVVVRRFDCFKLPHPPMVRRVCRR